MIQIHPQFIKDATGKTSMVVLRAKEFKALIDELEMREDIRLYDQAMATPDPAVDIDRAFMEIEARRKAVA